MAEPQPHTEASHPGLSAPYHDPTAPLRVGYVPEHFSTPIHILQQKILPQLASPAPLRLELVPFPSGTGAMISSLSVNAIDVAVGLTEGWIAGLAKGQSFYRIVGSYVESPLRWAISTGQGREAEFVGSTSSSEQGQGRGKLDLKGRKLGVSRIGSGSYVMGYVLAEQQGWLSSSSSSSSSSDAPPPPPPFEFVVLNDFKGLRTGVNSREADAFMWEFYTTKKYYSDPAELVQIGELPTPWPSWHIVARSDLLFPPSSSSSPPGGPPTAIPHRNPADSRVSTFLAHLNMAIKYFNDHPQEVLQSIVQSSEMNYGLEDASAWLGEVRFVEDVRCVRSDVVRGCAHLLRKAGVVPREDGDAEGGVRVDEMVVPVG